MKLEERVERLENTLVRIEEKLDRIGRAEEGIPEPEEKESLHEIYSRCPNKFFEMAERYNELADIVDVGDGSEEAEELKSLNDYIGLDTTISDVFEVLCLFDVKKVATIIKRYNEAADLDKQIATFQVESLNYDSILNGLRDNIKDLVKNLFEFGEANEKEPYLHYQVGRMHLDSIYVEKENFLRLYWSPETSDNFSY